MVHSLKYAVELSQKHITKMFCKLFSFISFLSATNDNVPCSLHFAVMCIIFNYVIYTLF